MKTIFHPGAWDDLRNQARYLKEQGASEDVLRGLFEAVRLARAKIEQNPQTWSFMSGSSRAQKVQIPRFGMQAVYTIRTDGSLLIIEFVGPGVQPRWAERL